MEGILFWEDRLLDGYIILRILFCEDSLLDEGYFILGM